jgi:quercetin dioxygenase-like cupin family protein
MATIQPRRRGLAQRPAPGVVRVHLDHLGDPVGHFDLAAVERELLSDEAVEREGHSAVTLAKYPDLRAVLVTLRKGAEIPEARAQARLSVHALRGRLRLRLPEGALDLLAGHLVTLERGMAFSVEARAASSFLLTVSWPHDGGIPPWYPMH